jgi:hypothetical protein
MTIERVRRLAFRTISQIGIRYPDSGLSLTLPGLPQGGPAAGDRFPWLHLKLQADGPVEDLFNKLNDTCFNLLLFGQADDTAEMAGWGELLHVYAVPDDASNDAELERAQIARPSAYLLRPDGHIGLCGTRLEPAAIKRYLFEYLHIS